MDLDEPLDARNRSRGTQRKATNARAPGSILARLSGKPKPLGSEQSSSSSKKSGQRRGEPAAPYRRPAIDLDHDSWKKPSAAAKRIATFDDMDLDDGTSSSGGAMRRGRTTRLSPSSIVITKSVRPLRSDQEGGRATAAAAATSNSVFSRINSITSSAGRPQSGGGRRYGDESTVAMGSGQRVRVGGMVSDRLDAGGSRLSTGIVPTERGETVVQLSNLHWEVSAEDLEHFFASFGPLKKCRVHYDRSGRSEGKADVTFSSERKALAAVERHNGANLDGLVLQMTIPALQSGRGGIVGASAAVPSITMTVQNSQHSNKPTGMRSSMLARLNFSTATNGSDSAGNRTHHGKSNVGGPTFNVVL